MLGLVATAGFKLKDWETENINHRNFVDKLDKDNKRWRRGRNGDKTP